MDKIERFGVSMKAELLQAFDNRIREKGYATRSEAIRDIIRDYLVEGEWEDQSGEVVGTVTIVYDHGTHELSDALTDIQHSNHRAIICATHVHLDEHNCLETVVIRGSSKEIRSIAERLIATRGVKHGKLMCTTTGRRIS
ncbi:MAG: nickel-responsive transcriptional regulator NikR [Armatimonadota bacterium]|nr:nickel-responsive transcriptional regulator NikR [Armatimonadota bacterium]